MLQLEFACNSMIHGSTDVQEEVRLKIEKSNKKYKAVAEKKGKRNSSRKKI